jgi:hypothetical protein
MAITFDATNKRIILDSPSVTATEIWIAWREWVVLSDNSKWLPALSQVGGDDLGGGLFIPLYFFLLNGWRVRPMEASHLLTLSGNLFVQGGGNPIVNTLGNYNVSVQYTVPVQAQAYNAGGGGGSYTPTQIAEAVWSMMLTSGLTANTTVSNTLTTTEALPTAQQIAQDVWDEVI